jgi:L,D-transpeptidase ErfK/SrfK
MPRFTFSSALYIFTSLFLSLFPGSQASATTYPLPPPGEQLIGKIEHDRASHDETLLDIALRHDLGHEEIVAANPDIDPWLPPDGALVTLPTQHILPDTPREGIVINMPELRLYYYPEAKPGEQPVVITYPISIGSEGRDLPAGLSRITEKKVKPSWNVPEAIRAEHEREGDDLPAVIPPGPDNPLGDYAMRLSGSSYLIHGTNRSFSIGMRISHGCIRMYPADIEALFPQVPIGTPVRIINQPFKAGWRTDELYVEAHKPLQEAEYAPKSGNATGMVSAIIKVSNVVFDDASWALTSRAAEQQTGIPIKIISAAAGKTLLRTATAPGLPPGETWWLQVGAFRNLDNAKNSAIQIGKLPSPLTTNLVTEGHLCHILIGPFAKRGSALNLGKTIHDHSDISSFPVPAAGLNGFRYCDQGG